MKNGRNWKLAEHSYLNGRGVSSRLIIASIFLSALSLALAGCGSSGSSPAANDAPAVTLSSIAQSPTALSLAVGATAQFRATGSYSDGSTKDLTQLVSWASSNPALATINAAGLATGLKVGGPATISSSFGNVASQPSTAMMTPGTPVIAWSSPSAITYGTALSATQLDATANTPGTFAYSPTAGNVPVAGSQMLSVMFTPTDTTDYTSGTATTPLTVNKATPTVMWAAPASITYGTALSATQLSATANVPGSFVYTPPLASVPGLGNQTLSVTFTPLDTTDYFTATATTTLTVNKTTPTLTWATPAAITYGAALSATQLNATANVPGNFVYTPPLATVLSAGSQTLSATFTPADAADYATATGTVSLTVTRATPTINWATPSAILYGTPLSATQLDATSGTAGTFAYTPPLTTVLSVGAQPLSVTLTPTDSTDYSAATDGVTLTVNRATPSITWSTPAAIGYGTALSATQLNATSSTPGAFAYTPPLATVLAAGNQTLSVTFTPTDTTDYSTATDSVLLTVNKTTPAITWATPAAIAYGTTLSATQLNAASDTTGTLAYTPSLGTVLNAGTQTLSVTLTPTDSLDYNATTATVPLTVNPATPTIAWATPASILYGTALSSTQLDATAGTAGTFVYSPAAGAVLMAGTQTLSVTFMPTDATDYTTATSTVQIDVNKIASVLGWVTPSAIDYGTALSATQLDATANIPGTFVYTPSAGTLLTVGTQMLSATFTPNDSTDYNAATTSTTITVNQGTPTITWAPPTSIPYGIALSAAQLDATANTPGNFVYTPPVGTVLTAGVQTLSVTFTPTDTTDYTTATATAHLSVDQVAPVITWVPPAAINAGTALSSTQLDAIANIPGTTVNVPGTFAYNPPAGTVPGMGVQSLSATFTPTDTTDYTTATATVSLTVDQAPTFTSASGAIFAVNALRSFRVVATGTPTPTYTESGALPAGVTFSSSGLISGTPPSTGVYPIMITASNGIPPDATQSFILTVNQPPVITTQPVSQTVNAGQPVTFSVVATGTPPLTYQWGQFTQVVGSDSPTYMIPVALPEDDGAPIAVMVSNSAGSVISNVVTLTVDSPAVIDIEPADQTVASGEVATFNVSASGEPAPTYQWFLNGVSVPNATSPTFTTIPTALSDNGDQVYVQVTNSFGPVNSTTATVSVVPAQSPATYYVDFSSGNDESSGISKDSPWHNAPGMYACSYNCNVVTLTPGDRVIFKGGVTWDATEFPMNVTSAGANGNPVYFGVDQTWFAGQAWSRPVFDFALNNSGPYTFAPLVVSSLGNLVFDNLELRNEQVDSLNTWPPRGSFTISGGSNITVQNCYIHGWSIQNPTVGSDNNPYGGIAFYNNSTGGVVQNCTIDGGPTSDSGTAIYGGTSIQGNIIENVPNGIEVFDPNASIGGNQIFNLLSSVDPTVQANAILVNGGGIIYNNIVHDLSAAASAVRLEPGLEGSGNTQYLYNNLIWNVGNNAPVIVDSQNLLAGVVSNQFLLNNTFDGGAQGCIGVTAGATGSANLTVQNNHCISDGTNSPAWCWNNANGNGICGSVTNPIFQNNILMTTAMAATQGYTSNESFQPVSGMVSTVGAGLNLLPDCVSAGTTLCNDRLGVSRPISGAWDAGAYLYLQTETNLLPAITTQPVSTRAGVGQTATFSVVATGAPQLSYQWQLNGVPISGATSSTYTTPIVGISDDGTVFTVVVSNGNGSAVSSPAVLSVTSGTGQIAVSTSNLDFGDVTEGASATMSVTLTSSGTAPAVIEGTVVLGAGFQAYTTNGVILAPGQTANLNVVFSPVGVGGAGGTITVNIDAPNSPIVISVSGLGVLPIIHSVNLNWIASTSPVSGYNVYRSNSPGGVYVRVNSSLATSTQFTDINVLAGATYFYVVTSVDSNNVESTTSNEASATVPSP